MIMNWQKESKLDCLKLIDEGICHADCCGIVPFTLSFWNTHKELAQITYCHPQKIDGSEMYFIHGKDRYCVFLNRETGRCAIYVNRPEACRRMGEPGCPPVLECPFFGQDGSLRTRAERRRFIRATKKRADVVWGDVIS